MTDPARFRRIEDLFLAAADLSADEREEFLRTECADDSSLTSVLPVDQRSAGLRSAPAFHTFFDPADEDAVHRLEGIALAKRAVRNIKAISTDPEKLKEPELNELLSKIISETNSRRNIIRKFKT